MSKSVKLELLTYQDLEKFRLAIETDSQTRTTYNDAVERLLKIASGAAGIAQLLYHQEVEHGSHSDHPAL